MTEQQQQRRLQLGALTSSSTSSFSKHRKSSANATTFDRFHSIDSSPSILDGSVNRSKRINAAASAKRHQFAGISGEGDGMKKAASLTINKNSSTNTTTTHLIIGPSEKSKTINSDSREEKQQLYESDPHLPPAEGEKLSITNDKEKTTKKDDEEKKSTNTQIILKDVAELQHHLELMHDRCIARNLRAAGLGGFDADHDELVYGILDPNAHMTTGETMLVATILNISDTVRLNRYVAILLAEGADVNERDRDGKTPLMHACVHGCAKAAKSFLHQEKLDLLVRDNDGNTACMYAAAYGRPKILKYYFKALRKREKHRLQRRQSSEQKNNNNSTATLSKDVQVDNTANNPAPAVTAAAETANTQIQQQQPNAVWTLFGGEDPLEAKNAHGKTARALAIKNGHLECADMISEEKQRRAKELNKRLYAINHAGSSPAFVRSVKRSAKKHFQHYGSFDSVYYDKEDQSDDELMHSTASAASGSTAAANGNYRKVRPGSAMTITGSNSHHHQQQQQQRQHHTQSQHSNQPKQLLLRLHKRFQSQPDLFKLPNNNDESDANYSYVDETQQPDHDTVMGKTSGATVGQQQKPIDNDDHAPPLSSATMSSDDLLANKHKISAHNRQNAQPGASSHSPRDTASLSTRSYPPQHQAYQPIIGGQQQQQAQLHPYEHQRRPSKRNLTEKLMNLLRRRPKPFMPVSASDAILCTAGDRGQQHQHPMLSRKMQQHSVPVTGTNGGRIYSNFSSIDAQAETDADDHEADRSYQLGRQEETRKGSLVTAGEQDPAAKQRRSIDISAFQPSTSQDSKPNEGRNSVYAYIDAEDAASTTTLKSGNGGEAHEPKTVDLDGGQLLLQLDDDEDDVTYNATPNKQQHRELLAKKSLEHAASWMLTMDDGSVGGTDSGLASSVASSAAGFSRPVSADSTTSGVENRHNNTPVPQQY